MMGAELTPAYETSLTAMIPTARTLAPGDSMAGLLVYRAFKPNTRKYKVDIQLTTADGAVTPIKAAYRRQKIEPSDGR
jgi:hypothetical protein